MQAEAKQVVTCGVTITAAKRRRWVPAALAAVCVAFLGYRVYYVVLGNNLHEIVPGQIYRSAQLSEIDLRRTVERYKIRTVINLRGCCPDTDWYQEESKTLRDLGVKQYDITFSSYVWPGIPELQQLIEVLKTCDPPMLMHCRRGADRTGMATAAALLLRTNMDLSEARRQLTWRYGHISLSRSNVHDRVFDLYGDWLSRKQQQHNPNSFYRWVMEDYRPGQCWAEIQPLDVPRHLPLGQPASFRFRVFNRSVATWHFRPNLNCGVHLHFGLRSETCRDSAEGGAGYFDADVAPGESIDLTLTIPPIAIAGHYQLTVDMADEQCCWFSLVGSMPLMMDVEVGDAQTK
jgi:hypothetical protein